MHNNIQSNSFSSVPISASGTHSESTEIQIDTTSAAGLQSDLGRDQVILDSTSIDMDYPSHVTAEEENVIASSTPMHRNILTLFSEARSQLGRTSSIPSAVHRQQNRLHSSLGHEEHVAPEYNGYEQHDHAPQVPPSSTNVPNNSRNIRSWRMNLNNVLSFSSAPSTEAIRSLITSSGSFRYAPLDFNDGTDNINVLMQPETRHVRQTVDNRAFNDAGSGSNQASRPFRGNPLRSESNGNAAPENRLYREESNTRMNNASNNGNALPSLIAGGDASHNSAPEGTVLAPFLDRNQHTTNRNTLQEDEDNNVISDLFVKVLSHFVRYLPFICILFVKFVHDHLLGILDLLLLHCTMYQVNKSLREQISKFSQKSFGILFRDFGLVLFVVAYRFVLASSIPDPFGLLISPPVDGVTLELAADGDSSQTKDKLAVVLSNYLGNIHAVKDQQQAATDNTVTITRAISMGVLLYYVAVNDLILKLITILLKISITLMPTRVIRHKPRARMYVVVEYFSQFYRSLAPVRQWLMFLFESYSGLEVISGILFSSFYMGAKGFEFVERGKSFKKALLIFLRNMDYERKPTSDELDAAGSVCPICHDAFSTPVVLDCGHIFCDDCVSTWFKREQTCPMCRAKVSEDPTWKDGSTTFFYQLC